MISNSTNSSDFYQADYGLNNLSMRYFKNGNFVSSIEIATYALAQPDGIYITIKGLPTSSSQPSGTVYKDSNGFLKIV